MTTLLVAGGAVLEQHSGQRVARMSECLQGDWAVLFSDPQDFAPHASTPPGFLIQLADAFRCKRTRPFAVIRSRQPRLPTNWLQRATDDRSLLVLDCTASHRVVDFAARALLRKLRRLEAPYVLVLDQHGRCRSTICYRAHNVGQPRTVVELLCVVAALRGDRVPAGVGAADSADTVLTP